MAVVYAATHRNQMRVAVKMLHPELSLSEDLRRRFLREGYAANSVGHEGALKVLDDDVAEDGAAFLVLELLDGSSAEQHWERHGHRLPAKAVVALGHELCDVLAAAHAKGIIHRDIKPANLFVTRKGELRVLDFGIARVRDAATSGGGNVTTTGVLLGTPAFMPPEQALAQADQMDGRADQWAVGATMFTLVSGRLVHLGDNASQIMIAAATRAAPSLSSVAPGVPPEIVAVIDRALAFQKSDRWPDVGAMRDALAQAYRSTFGEVLSTAPLRALFSGHENAVAPTMPSSPNPVVPSTHTLTALQMRPAEAIYPPRQSLEGAGLSTAKPVSTESPADMRRRRTAVAALGVTAGVLLLVGAGVAMRLHRGSAPPSSAFPATGSASAPATSTWTTPAASEVPATAPLAVTAASAPTPSSSFAPAPAPSVVVAPRGRVGATQTQVAAVPGASTDSAVPARSSSKPAPVAASPAKPVCTAASYLGQDGETHWKQVCN
jgi:serine/threonine-protein kinase